MLGFLVLETRRWLGRNLNRFYFELQEGSGQIVSGWVVHPSKSTERRWLFGSAKGNSAEPFFSGLFVGHDYDFSV